MNDLVSKWWTQHLEKFQGSNVVDWWNRLLHQDRIRFRRQVESLKNLQKIPDQEEVEIFYAWLAKQISQEGKSIVWHSLLKIRGFQKMSQRQKFQLELLKITEKLLSVWAREKA
jgi:hypothetical protein